MEVSNHIKNPESVMRLTTESLHAQLCCPENMNQCVAVLLHQDYFLSFFMLSKLAESQETGAQFVLFFLSFFHYLFIKLQHPGSFSCCRAGGRRSYPIRLSVCICECVYLCLVHVPKVGPLPSLVCHSNTWQ